MTRLVDDRALRERFKQGEADALCQVYDLYAPIIFSRLKHGFVFRGQGGAVCRFRGYDDAGELENAVQEVFCRAFAERARLAYDGLRPYQSYIFTIARNYVADHYRRATHQFVPLGDDAHDSDGDVGSVEGSGAGAVLVSAEPAPDSAWEQRELRAHVEAFVAGLDALEREIFRVRLRQGASVEETAAALAVSEYRVKRTEQTICKRFFATMRRHGYFEGLERSWASRISQEVSALVMVLSGGLG